MSPGRRHSTAPRIPGDELIALDGGPWAGHVYWLTDLRTAQRSAELQHLDLHDHDRRCYLPTNRTTENRVGYGTQCHYRFVPADQLDVVGDGTGAVRRRAAA